MFISSLRRMPGLPPGLWRAFVFLLLACAANVRADAVSDASVVFRAAIQAYAASPTAVNSDALASAKLAYRNALAANATTVYQNPGTVVSTTRVISGIVSAFVAPDASVTFSAANSNIGLINVLDSTRAYHIGSADAASNGEATSITFGPYTNTSYGGAIVVRGGGTVTVDDATFTDNTADYGGAISMNNGGTVTITDSKFVNNRTSGYADDGGAISNLQGRLFIADSEFTGNVSDDYGGAIYNLGDLVVVRSTFTANSTISVGAAITNLGGNASALITGCVFEGNLKGALYNTISQWATGAFMDIRDSTFTRNIHTTSAAIYNDRSELRITDSNFTNNSSTVRGGAISNASGTIRLSVTEGKTSLFSGNTAAGASSSISFNGSSAGINILDVDMASGGSLDMRDPMGIYYSLATAIEITKTGSGVWKLGGNNNFSNVDRKTFTVSEGTLYLYGGGEVDNDILATETVETVAAGSLNLAGAASSFTVGGSGVLQAGGANAVGTAGSIFLMDGATLRGGNGATSLTLTAAGGVSIDGKAFVSALNENDVFTLNASLSGGSLGKSGPGRVILNGTNSLIRYDLAAGTLALGSAGALGDSGVIAFHGGALQFTEANTTDYSGRFDTAANQQYRIDTNGRNVTLASALVSNGGNLAKLGDGTLTLAGTNTYSGGTTIRGGTLSFATDANLGDISGALTIDGGTLRNTAPLITAREVIVGTAGATFENGGGYLTLTTPVSGTGGITRTGGGILTLHGNQTYEGPTVISNGHFKVQDGTLASPSVSLAEGSNFYAVNIGNYTGEITGDGTFQSDGNNTLTGAATNAGGAVVNSGTLQIGDGGGTGSLTGDVSIATGAKLAVNRSGNIELDGEISGNGSLSKSGDGTLILPGENTYTGGTVLAGGTLRLANDSALGAGPLTTRGSVVDYADGVNIANPLVLDSDHTELQVLDGIAEQSGDISEENGPRPLAKIGDGTLILSGENTYTGATTVSAGKLVIGSDYGVPSTSAVTVASGATLAVRGDDVWTSYAEIGSLAGGGTVEIQDFARITVGADNSDTVFSGSIVSTGAYGDFEKTGSGKLTLTGTSTIHGLLELCSCDPGNSLEIDGGSFTTGDLTLVWGGTLSVVNGGRLETDEMLTFGTVRIAGAGSTVETGTVYVGDIGSEGTLEIGEGGTLTAESVYVVGLGSLTVDGAIGDDSLTTVAGGGVLDGSGAVGDLLVSDGGILAPGNSPGTLGAQDTTWEGGGTYIWELDSATGTAGTNWDLLSVSGTLTLDAIGFENPFTIAVTSLDAGNAPGDAANFDPSQSYTWILASASGGISGFNADQFSIDTSAFSNAPNSDRFTIGSDGTNLTLTYSAVPEPAEIGIALGLGLLALAAVRRRRHRRAVGRSSPR